jgi:catechol 2,3-dioxygenase-like lactoylglutathione lyase family enzyme
MKIHHFGIQVKDIDRSIVFYIEKLGFEIKTCKTLTSDGAYLYANLALGSSGVELELIQIVGKVFRKTKSSEPPICPHIALESDDFDRDLLALQEKGVQIFDEPHIIPNDVKILLIHSANR